MNDEDVWKVVSGVTRMPVPAAGQRELTPAQKEEAQKYEKLELKALRIIVPTIDGDLMVQQYLGNMTPDSAGSAYLWTQLKEAAEKKRKGVQLKMLSDFYQFRYDSRKSADENFVKFDGLVRTLQLSGERVSVGTQLTVLLQSLPSSWRAFQSAYNASGSETVDGLKQAIAREACHLQVSHNKDMSRVTAMFSNLENGQKASHPKATKPQNKLPTHHSQNGKGKFVKWCEFCRRKGRTTYQFELLPSHRVDTPRCSCAMKRDRAQMAAGGRVNRTHRQGLFH